MTASTTYRVVHRTHYVYSRAMSDGYTLAYLLPRPTAQQVVEQAEVTVTPEPDERFEHVDMFGNRVLQIGMHHSHDELDLVAESLVTFEPLVVRDAGPSWEDVAEAVDRLRGGEALAVRPLGGSSPYVDLHVHEKALLALSDDAFVPGRPVLDATRRLCHTIYASFDYDGSFTDVSTPLSTVLEARRGVCQDFAHLAAGALRVRGLAARYVSGYLETSPPPGQQRLLGADASHAWCSVWVPQLGWVDFDPTNDRMPTHRHITVAWGRDYGDVAPVRGVVIGPSADQRLDVEVDVLRA